ncbi:hypothetical protein EWM64_g9563 [Hericium alpestre]|uniref:Uncharacterized protein n=1 Tax=Hericium alpestre TaxID=135208 RepID=A0A4Y9ZJT8_9AGAM|nr:hypothetical protein EWM64_g9563 [Hericium alpestre]
MLAKRAHTREEKHAARLKIEDDMAAIAALLRDVEKMQNMVYPISCLPPEVLCRIFASSALVEKPEPWTFGQPRGARLGWIKVTHIMKELVRRSRQSPLCIELRSIKRDAYTWDALQDMLALELPRVKGLTLGDSAFITTCLLRLFEDAPGRGSRCSRSIF